jgi:hypothetical protein
MYNIYCWLFCCHDFTIYTLEVHGIDINLVHFVDKGALMKTSPIDPIQILRPNSYEHREKAWAMTRTSLSCPQSASTSLGHCVCRPIHKM